MGLIAIVREALHDGQYGCTFLVKDSSLLAIQEAIINRSNCHLVETISPIISKKAIVAFEVLTNLNLSRMDKFILDLGRFLVEQN